jgi:hypothetical protein
VALTAARTGIAPAAEISATMAGIAAGAAIDLGAYVGRNWRRIPPLAHRYGPGPLGPRITPSPPPPPPPTA